MNDWSPEIATDRRFQLNAREQRILANELVHDITGLGPLEQLLEDDTIADIMVNGPHRTFIEKAGKVTLANVHFRDQAHLMVCASASPPLSDGASTMNRVRWLTPA